MGYTQFTKDLVSKYLKDAKSVIDLGSQNDYTTAEEKPPFISEWYKGKNIKYRCIDLAGDNDAIGLDLAHPINSDVGFIKLYDIVLDIGTGEHIVQMEGCELVSFHDGHINSIYPKGDINISEGYYNCWLNKHKLCKLGGLIISENPMTNNWPSHGYSYLGIDFYTELCNNSTYTLVETGIHGASGNWTDGINVYGVIRKNSDDFLSFEEFNKLPIFRS